MKVRYIFLFALLFYLPSSFGVSGSGLRAMLVQLERGKRETYIERLKDQNADINWRIEAAKALGEIGGGEAVSALKEALGDSRREVRAKAVDVLGEIGGEEVVSSLKKTSLRDPSKKVRARAASALNKIECKRAIVKSDP